MGEKNTYLKKHGTDHLIEVLRAKAASIKLPEGLSLRNVETKQGDDWFQIIINCFSPKCKSDGQKTFSIFSPEVKELHDCLVDQKHLAKLGWTCQDFEILPDYEQNFFGCVGTRFWFQFIQNSSLNFLHTNRRI